MTSNQNPSWERVRIKTKYADIIRKVASRRDEPFLDALYYIIDTYWQANKNNTSGISTIATDTTVTDQRNLTSIEDVDTSDFE
ncbi:hypothetical protein NIES4106_61720 (plasmid) [Fischerella sp. NIES-4106]|nr:hypothetical protein NIES4106_61720 [Fischerella sp. NIES-4106]